MNETKKINWIDVPNLLAKSNSVIVDETGKMVLSAEVDGSKVRVVLQDLGEKVFAGYRMVSVTYVPAPVIKKTDPNVLRPGKTERQKEKRARYLQNKAEKAAANRARAQSSGKQKK